MIDQLLNDVTDSGIASRSEFHGLSDSEIATVEQLFGVCLPPPYKTFLRTVGRGAGKFLRSDHWYFTVDSLPELNAAARPRLDAAGLHGPWFCFATRMGEVELFFLADGANDDPPIFFWNEESDPKIEKGFESFGRWLRSMIDEYRSWQ